MLKLGEQLLPVALAGALYARRWRRLRHRPPRWKAACFYGGLGVVVAALVPPVDRIGEERLFWVHMCQHVLIGDVAPFLVVLGLSGPLLRPVLAFRVVQRLRVLAHPAVAFPLWAVNLGVWHVPALYDAALAHDTVHALQHALFFAGGALVWSALFGVLPGPRWFGTGARALYLTGMWFFSLALSSVFLWSRRPFYSRYTVPDQRLGGGVMLLEGSLIMLGVLVWLGVRWFAEAEARQQAFETRHNAVPVAATGLRDPAPAADGR